jgi:uncharacterized protein YyaL (SSP411 family)
MSFHPQHASHAHTNRLATETSPYLLQHAHNPVDWHAWGPEAIELSRKLDKPIFLSVGYSTCYWCHVMERQCFEVEAIAAQMNRLVINIKVDREERPDIDQLYMLTVQIMTRQGGWPMSVFLTPDLKPFFGGTYFPPRDSHGRPGFPRLLAAIDDAYRNRRDEVEQGADDLVDALRKMSHLDQPRSSIRIDARWIDDMIRRCIGDFDSVHGGFGGAPKFPRQTLLELLLVYLRKNPDAEIEKMLRVTLDSMAHGGIRDHLGGGFHRYSTDDHWLVPHFEIMLYDNAMLAWIYAEFHQQTGDARYAAIARGIADFVLREMTAPNGAFFTALDAEVDSQEGGNYLWTRQEVVAVLAGHADSAQIERFCRVYGLDAGPNFADPHHGSGVADKNVLFLAESMSEGKSAFLDPDLARLREILYAQRRKRKQPLLDTKILTSWNALMIRALAHAERILKEDRYIQAAIRSAEFLMSHHRDQSGGLLRVSAPAFLDDYAFLIQALLDLSIATGDAKYRAQADELAAKMRELFADENGGGLFYSDARAKDLIVRQKIAGDSPLPSGNAIAAMTLLERGQGESAGAIIAAFSEQMETFGEGMGAMIQAAMQFVSLNGVLEIVPHTSQASPRIQSPTEQARDILSIQTHWLDPSRLQVRCTIAQGFHLNSNDPAPGLVATRLSVAGKVATNVERIEYPAPKSLDLADSSILAYEGSIVITVKFTTPPPSGKTVDFSLNYQPCDANSCLSAATLGFSSIAP